MTPFQKLSCSLRPPTRLLPLAHWSVVAPRFRAAEHQPIHTMLAIGLADLAIQMDPRYRSVRTVRTVRWGGETGGVRGSPLGWAE